MRVPWDDALYSLWGIVVTWFVLSLVVPWQCERAINFHFSGSEAITGSETEEQAKGRLSSSDGGLVLLIVSGQVIHSILFMRRKAADGPGSAVVPNGCCSDLT
jgi:hypothetical protein